MKRGCNDMAIWCNAKRQLFVTRQVSPGLPVSAWEVVKVPGAGKSPADELTRRAPRFLPLRFLGGAERLSAVSRTAQNFLVCVGNLAAKYI